MSCLQLAWEMLEVARSIYSKMGDEKALDLAGTSVATTCAWQPRALARPSYMGSPWHTYVMQVRRHDYVAADVHVLLGDIGMEEERFESSASDYEEALKLLAHKLEVCIACYCAQPHSASCCALSQLDDQPYICPNAGPCIMRECAADCKRMTSVEWECTISWHNSCTAWKAVTSLEPSKAMAMDKVELSGCVSSHQILFWCRQMTGALLRRTTRWR